MRAPAPKKRVRLAAAERRQQIVEAAFDAIAKHGFEGLRTRDVADRLGINSATLHHHFPTKNDLIAAVADELGARLQSDKAPLTAPLSATAALERQFADAKRYRARQPKLLAVFREFSTRAHRDRLVASLVERLNETWRRDIQHALDQAVRERLLRPEIDPEVMARILVHVIWGLVTAPQRTTTAEIERAFRQIRALLLVSA